MRLYKLLLSGLLFLISVAVSNSQVVEANDSLLHSWNFSKASWVKNTVSDSTDTINFKSEVMPVFDLSLIHI